MDETYIAFVAAIAAVIASGIGAGGAILAQFLTVRATDKASAKRFKWEQEQAIRREKAERDALFAEAKRVLFAKYLAVHSEYRLELTVASYWAPSDRVVKMRAARNKYAEEVFQVQSEIALIAPPLTEVTRRLLVVGGGVFGAVRDAFPKDGPSGPSMELKELSDYFGSIETCRKAMAAHLQGEPIPEA